MASREINRLRDDIEPFQSELMEEFYRNYAGLKDDFSTVGIYDKYAHLFSENAIESIRVAIEENPEPEELRCLKYLRGFAISGYLDNSVKLLTDKAKIFEAQSIVSMDGEAIPYRSVPIKIRNEADLDRRRRLFESKLVETDKLNEILLERMETLHDLSAVLGFKNYRELCSSLKGIDYKALEEQMEEMLRRTEKLYVESMDSLMEEKIGLKLSEAWSFDVPYAFRGGEYDKYFVKERLIELFFATIKGIGIDPERYDNIHLDIEDRPKKNPRAFCSPVHVPGDIRLVIRPSGGARDFESFFHEAGHAWHFGSTWSKHPPEYRYLGDNSVTEAFAFVFDYLTGNKLWLEKYLGMENSEEYVRFALVNKLMFLRRYASKLIYELKLNTGKVSPEFQEVYRNSLQKGLRFKHTGKHYLEDVDDAFYCAEYLRAWILEGQLRAALEDEFGDHWFANEKTGSFLKELWSYGQKYTADELVKTVGYVDLDMDPLLTEIERGLSG